MIDPQVLQVVALAAIGGYGWAWVFEQWDDADFIP